MEKLFLSYELALEVKTLGFDEPCLFDYNRWNTERLNSSYYNYVNYNAGETMVSAPLFQQVFKWFRDKYDLWFRPDYYDEMREYDYQGSIHQLGRYSSLASLDNCKTVEELEAKCIDKLIEIVKNK